MSMLLFLLACSNLSPSEMAVDRTVSLEDAVSACGDISDDRRQGRCIMKALKFRGAIAPDTCDYIPGGGLRGEGLAVDGKSLVDRGLGLGIQWHDECLFTAASRSTASQSARDRMCREASSYTRSCLLQLWQKDIKKLRRPPAQAGNDALVKLESVIADHRLYAEPLDRDYEVSVRTWFWGSWWQRQGIGSEYNPSACKQWLPAGAQAACETWALGAYTWVKDRETNRPR